MLYIHGGGWIMGSPKTHDKLAKQCAAEGYLTINLDYRLAPENPFPAGLDDCVSPRNGSLQREEMEWRREPARDRRRSAGGNLTAATLVALSSDASAPKARAGALIYGVFDFPALIERAKNNPMLEGMARAYLGSQYPAALTDPRVSPMRGVKAGRCRMLRDLRHRGRTACRIQGDGGSAAPRQHRERAASDGRNAHAFMQMNELSACREGLKSMFAFLRRHV